MVRGPQSSNGTRSPVYYLTSAGLGPPRSRARALNSETGPPAAGTLTDGSLAAVPGLGVPPPAAQRGTDQVAQSRLLNDRPAFFHAYTSSDSAALNRFAVRGVSLGSATRQITITVIWQLPEPPGSNTSGNPGMTKTLKMTYGMSVIDLRSGKWYVKEIGASTEAVGAR